MASRTLAWLTLFFLVGALALRTQSLLRPAENDTLSVEQDTYQRVRKLIQDRYVTNVEERKLFYNAMKGMVSGLDPHTQFFTPEEYEPFKTSTTGELEGVGIELDWSEERGLVVVTPLQGTPAWDGGVLPGDRILKIDGVAAKGMKLDEASRRIKGLPGTAVALTLLHDGAKDPVEVTLKRATIEIKSVQDAEILGPEWVPAGQPKIGYVQLEQFQQRSGADLDAALTELEREGMQALVLDLRGNRGGLLRAAKEVASLFLKPGTEIVRVINRLKDVEIHTADGEHLHPSCPLVVLIDGGSASASEIVAGALKDAGRATLVGDHSYGKFSVQEVDPLPLSAWGDAGLKLTIAKYKTPKQPCKDGEGIVPDYAVPSSPDQQRALFFDRLKRHLRTNDPRGEYATRSLKDLLTAAGASESAIAKAQEQFVDLQLKKAVEVLRGQLAQPPRK